jgi:hypothetical protein
MMRTDEAERVIANKLGFAIPLSDQEVDYALQTAAQLAEASRVVKKYREAREAAVAAQRLREMRDDWFASPESEHGDLLDYLAREGVRP